MTESSEDTAPAKDKATPKNERRKQQLNRAAAIYFDACRKLAGAVNRLRSKKEKSS